LGAAAVFFAQFWQWLSDRLTDYVSEHVATTAAAIEPAAVSLAVIYVMVWGFLHLKGAIEEPVIAGALRIARLAVVFGVGLQLWQYNEALVNTFMDAPTELAAALAGAADPIGTVDALWEQGGLVASTLWEKGGVLDGEVGFYIAAAVVYALVGAVCVYTLFLMALARVAVALLLAVGPMFILMLLFESTQKFFEAWIAQLANYALVGVLAVLTASLMLTVVEAYATQTAAKGAAILTVDALDMLLVAGLVLLLLRQVMPIAARLGGGVALTSFGVASAALERGSRLSGVLGRRVGGGLAASMSERMGADPAAWRAASAVPAASVAAGISSIGRVLPVWRMPGGGRGA
jgi:type IV secretion system protein VirB6